MAKNIVAHGNRIEFFFQYLRVTLCVIHDQWRAALLSAVGAMAPDQLRE